MSLLQLGLQVHPLNMQIFRFLHNAIFDVKSKLILSVDFSTEISRNLRITLKSRNLQSKSADFFIYFFQKIYKFQLFCRFSTEKFQLGFIKCRKLPFILIKLQMFHIKMIAQLIEIQYHIFKNLKFYFLNLSLQ